MRSSGKFALGFVLKGRRNPAWANGLVITHIFDSVSYSYSVERYSYSKHPGMIEYEYRPVD